MSKESARERRPRSASSKVDIRSNTARSRKEEELFGKSVVLNYSPDKYRNDQAKTSKAVDILSRVIKQLETEGFTVNNLTGDDIMTKHSGIEQKCYSVFNILTN